jgi:hypothetical protein
MNPIIFIRVFAISVFSIQGLSTPTPWHAFVFGLGACAQVFGIFDDIRKAKP